MIGKQISWPPHYTLRPGVDFHSRELRAAIAALGQDFDVARGVLGHLAAQAEQEERRRHSHQCIRCCRLILCECGEVLEHCQFRSLPRPMCVDCERLQEAQPAILGFTQEVSGIGQPYKVYQYWLDDQTIRVHRPRASTRMVQSCTCAEYRERHVSCPHAARVLRWLDAKYTRSGE